MLQFYKAEFRDLLISSILISLVFAYFLSINDGTSFLFILIISFTIIMPSFILHEAAHKLMAHNYGFPSFFKMSIPGLVLALFVSYLGIIFINPGAVYIKGDKVPSKSQMGKISVVGPFVNLFLAVFFFIFAFVFILCCFFDPQVDINNLKYNSNIFTILFTFGFYGYLINSFIAAFNLLPFSIFDGGKIFMWNKVIWAIMAGLSSSVLIFLFLVIG